jgi:hypothetical protein
MIRDPSDGTVKEKQERSVLSSPASGLPITKGNADEIARLEKSREWLKTYMERTP